MAESKLASCPDGGACHHQCGRDGCFRVISCVPLGAANFPDDRWPAALATEHRGRFLALRAAREMAVYGADVHSDHDGFTLSQAMLGGTVAWFHFQGESFALMIVPMERQDETGPFFTYEPRPEG